jgi:hypothetical protein
MRAVFGDVLHHFHDGCKERVECVRITRDHFEQCLFANLVAQTLDRELKLLFGSRANHRATCLVCFAWQLVLRGKLVHNPRGIRSKIASDTYVRDTTFQQLSESLHGFKSALLGCVRGGHDSGRREWSVIKYTLIHALNPRKAYWVQYFVFDDIHTNTTIAR